MVLRSVHGTAVPVLVLATVVMSTVVSCGADADDGVAVTVVALDNSFRPQVIEITVGDEVVWENRGSNDHDVLSISGGDWGVLVDAFGPGDAYAHVFTESGEYRYYCSIHGNEAAGMVGTVIVSP